MSILSDISTLENMKEQLNLLISKDSKCIEDKYKQEILKEEIINILCYIFSTYSTNILSNSFYLQVNEIESKIYKLIEEKNVELHTISKQNNEAIKINRNILEYTYSICNLTDNIHVSLNIEKRLLDMKNDVIEQILNKKRLSALKFIKQKFPCYIDGLKELVKLVYTYNDKASIPFEKRQRIYEIMSDISLKNQLDKNHSKMFNEDLNISSTSTFDYIKWYENIFLENCDVIGLNLNSFYIDITNYLNDKTLHLDSIISYIDEYIMKKYRSDILQFSKQITKHSLKAKEQLENQLSHCYEFNENFTYHDALIGIEKDSTLPQIFNNIIDKNYLKQLLYTKNISINESVIFRNNITELNLLLIKNFNYQDYLDLYTTNSKYKNRQIASFRQYYIDILNKSKQELIDVYIEKINEKIYQLKENNISLKENSILNENKICEIEELNRALEYINKNYREFNESNYKLYLTGVEQKYNVKNLYETISVKSSTLFFKLKVKNIIKKYLPYISSYINNTDLVNTIKEKIIDNIILSDNLKFEINKI